MESPLRLALLLLAAGCATPVAGTLPEGIYGSPDLGLRVDADGAATFERSCGRGELGVVTVTDGSLHADFEWIVTGGDPETGEPVGTPATVDADVTSTRVVGTIESDGQSEDLRLRFGEEPTYFECP